MDLGPRLRPSARPSDGERRRGHCTARPGRRAPGPAEETTATETPMDIRQTASSARQCAARLATAPTESKNAALHAMADLLAERRAEVLAANEEDMAAAADEGLGEHLVSRLRFGEAKIESRIRCLGKIAALPDPVGQTYATDRRPNGLEVARMRVPLGVILMIYEARPHVTVNGGAFCLKAGNAAILRGGSEARRCNELLGRLWQEALAQAGLPSQAVQVVSGSHEEIGQMLSLDEHIDLVIPRGGKKLIRAVCEQSRIPVIKHYAGVCHVYLDEGSDLERGLAVALDSKTLMPEVCNAMETLLVARALEGHLPRIVEAFRDAGVEVRGDERVRAAVGDVSPASDENWTNEYLDMVVSVGVVDDVGGAIAHINAKGSHHTDAIVTDSESRARRFVREVDSGVVLVNASTMFCDGESLGMGAEIGISTDKLHARGPMGLCELTTYKFVIRGEGHVMGSS
ncbi:MAG: glutamate-5-semialdehyde dehydrogenase [Candidatus Brocadiia bacterium]